MEIIIKDIKEIRSLGNRTKKELRSLNPHGAYYSDDLTKNELIYQIVFLRDAPERKNITPDPSKS